jgi:hypothetical protein
MKFKELAVSGINNIVIAHKVKWVWTDGFWVRSGAPVAGDAIKHHEEMMEIVNRLKADRRYRMWVHWDTLNIVRVVK